jgi:Protein of unknown function (DUF3106)
LKRFRLIAICLIAPLAFMMGWGIALAQPVPSGAVSQKSPAQPDAAWRQLTEQQRKALAPLAPHWPALNPSQKNKWLAMSNNFEKLSSKEQAILHERMASWASLSPQQRAQARLTFSETKSIGADEKKTQWEAYQALSEDDKKKLAAQQKTGIQGAATASQAAPPNKLMRLPGKSPAPPDANNANSGTVIDKKTLLPSPVVLPEGT